MLSSIQEIVLINVWMLAVAAIGYFAGKRAAQAKESSNLSVLSILASVYAASETKALKQAPILRQYVEKYVAVKQGEEEQKVLLKKMEDMQREFSALYGFGEPEPTQAEGKKLKVTENGIPPESLV